MSEEILINKAIKLYQIIAEAGLKHVPSFGRSIAEEIIKKTNEEIKHNPELRKKIIEVLKN